MLTAPHVRFIAPLSLFMALLLVPSTLAFASDNPAAVPETTDGATATLELHATATLTPEQVSQPEVIFVYSVPLPPGQELFLGLKGELSLFSQQPVFNETLITVATNASGACPSDGMTFPNYGALYAAYPNLVPLQSFILKSPIKGTNKLPVDYVMPAGLPISDCAVLFLDWEGDSKVTISSYLTMTYTTDTSQPSGYMLGTNQEFVFGLYIGPGSTKNDSLSFVQETKITQPGSLVQLIGDISDSTFGGPVPPGNWRALNDIYLVRGGCPSDIHVNSGGWTPKGGNYYSDIPSDAVHLLNAPMHGYQNADAQTFVNKPLNVKVQKGDCLLTLFGLNAPQGGGIDSENQVKTLFVPAP
jgi:hypothetical protein